VYTYRKKRAAERAAQRVHGVMVVACDIEVKIATLGSDAEIAEAIRDALRWNSAINNDKIEVRVDSGWVYLDGKVDCNYQKKSIEDSVQNLIGVKGISNNISIITKEINVKDIKHKISEAFHRDAIVDSSAIKIEAIGTKVILSGTVRSWLEKQEAERIAWSSPGVLTLENKIKVDYSKVFA